jgi:hypothetical protein
MTHCNWNTLIADVQKDYDELCARLGIDGIPLDIYPFVLGGEEQSLLGTSTGNGTALYDGTKIVLPIFDNSLDEHTGSPDFPPAKWDPLTSVWPVWRIELWHEVCHQVEDKLLGCWQPRVEGGPCWDQAVEYIAGRFDVEPHRLQDILVNLFPEQSGQNVESK